MDSERSGGGGSEEAGDALTAEIAAAQRRDVAAAAEDLGKRATVLAVSERTDLHPWVVVRRLRELGLDVPGMDWKPVRKERSDSQRAETTRFLEQGQKANHTPEADK